MEKIAIIRRNGLGDLLCAYPLFCHLKREYPEAEITLFVDERNAPLLKYFPTQIKAVVFPKRGNKYLNLFRIAWKNRGTGFDLAVSAKTSPMKMMNLFLFLLSAKKRVAVPGVGWHSKLINHPAFPKKEAHQALKCLQMVCPDARAISPELYPKLKLPAEIANQYVDLVKVRAPYLLLSASTTRVESRLEEKRYAEIVNRLSLEFSFSVLIVGQPNDVERAKKIGENLRVAHQIHIPSSFAEFMVLLSKADLYFVGDGGVAHIGAGFGKREVVFFGGTHPREWGPLNLNMEAFYDEKDVNCIPQDELLKALRIKAGEVFCE